MKKKFLIVVMAMCLLAAIMIGGTLAWLTDKTNTITNIFTFGMVDIDLVETSRTYKIVPGTDLDKDPTVQVMEGSEACWLFVKLEETDPNDIIGWTIATGWNQLMDGETPVAGVYYRSQDAVAEDEDEEDGGIAVSYPVLLGNKVTVAGTIEKEAMTGEVKLAITAYAVQTDATITTAAAAWAIANPVNPV